MIGIFATRKNRIFWLFILAPFVLGLYLGSNHLQLGEPQLMPLFWVDKIIPYIPQTSWVYLTLYFYAVLLVFKIKEDRNVSCLGVAYVLSAILSTIIFILYPTTYPRIPVDPLNGDFGMRFIHFVDAPSNCFPSMHIATITFAFMFFQRERKSFAWGYLIWGILICLSTITTRQHYFVDVVGGLFFGIFSYWISDFLVKKPVAAVVGQE